MLTHNKWSGDGRRATIISLNIPMVKTLYLTHYKRSGASGNRRSEANRSRNLVIFVAARGD